MKKLFIIICLFISVSVFAIEKQKFNLGTFILNILLPYEELVVPEFYSTYDISHWIWVKIDYDDTGRNIDNYQRPEETLQKQSGTCIDMCALFVYIAEKNGFTGCVMYPSKEKKTGGNHVVVLYNGDYFDPTNNIVWDQIRYDRYYVPIGWTY